LSEPRRPGRRRWVTAAIATAAVLAIGASAWLFATQRDDSPSTTDAPARTDEDRADGVLELPKEDGTGTTGDAHGRERLDPDEVTSSAHDADEPASTPGTAQPGLLRNLRGRSVAIALASGPCTTGADRVRSDRQRDLADALAAALEAAGATAAIADDATACPEARSRLQRADFAIVVGDSEDARVVAAPSAADAGAPNDRSRALATELAGWLGLDRAALPRTAAARREVTEHGAVTRTATAAVALVEVRANDLVPSRVEALADSIASGIAAAASHAPAVSRPAARPTAGARP
jgi:hypothetical protein